MATKNEYEKRLENRLVRTRSGYFEFYPEPDESWITVVLYMRTIEYMGYSFNAIGVRGGMWHLLFEKKKSD